MFGSSASLLGAARFPRVQSIDRQTMKNNVVALAKAAKVFKIIPMAINKYLFCGMAQQCGWGQ